MSSNFFNNNGTMTGADLHTYLMVGPEPITAFFGIPVKNHPYMVYCPFAWPSNEKRCLNVTASGAYMVKGSFDLNHVPHFGVPIPPPAPTELVNLLAIILCSSSKPLLQIGSVTGNGEPLAVCVMGAFSMNVNCGGVPKVLNIVNNANTVETSPSAGDFAKAAVRLAVALGVEKFVDVPGPIKNKIAFPLIENLIKYIEKKIAKKAWD